MKFAERSVVEQGQALEVVMGALKIAQYPPAPRHVQARIVASEGRLPPNTGIETLRQELAALTRQQFEQAFMASMNPLPDAAAFGLVGFGPMGGTLAAYGRALCEEDEPDPRYQRFFQRIEGYERDDAVFMTRFFAQLLEHLGEPERSDFEDSIVGTGPERERTKRWVTFTSKYPPAWLRAYMASNEAQRRSDNP